MLIQITELQKTEFDDFIVQLSFDNQDTFEVKLTNIHDDKTEENLEWYFEEYMNEPYIAESKVESNKKLIEEYGIRLFEEIFIEDEALELFQKGLNEGLDNMIFEIISQPKTLEFQSILWEALRDPTAPKTPLSANGVLFYRKINEESTRKPRYEAHSDINLLIVTARPSEENDVNYRTIQRPLVGIISENSFRVNPYILRPGTYKALKEHLIEVGSGYYHIIHFDLHGEVLSYKKLILAREKEDLKFSYGNNNFGKTPISYNVGYGRSNIKEYSGKQAFLFFETDKKGQADPASAENVANLLRDFQIPIAILNACQTAKQEGTSNETSLAKSLHEKGIDLVLAMRYSVSVTAAKKIMERFYSKLFDKKSIGKSISSGRRLLFDDKNRDASLGFTIELEDWLLPVIYKRRDVDLKLRTPSIKEEVNRAQEKINQVSFPKTIYGFHGRDLDILKIEKLLLNTNHLLVRGMVGIGKSQLLKYLAAWWTTTKFRDVKNVFYLDFKSSRSLVSLLDDIAKIIFTDKYFNAFKVQKLDFKEVKLIEYLNQNSYAIMLDNIFQFSDDQTIHFLKKLTGKSFVIYGSVNDESKLEPHTFQNKVYLLEGLDKDATYQLAKEIIRTETDKILQDLIEKNQFEMEHLLSLLAGFPSAMEIVLPFLKEMTVTEVLDGFRNGTLDINF